MAQTITRTPLTDPQVVCREYRSSPSYQLLARSQKAEASTPSHSPPRGPASQPQPIPLCLREKMIDFTA